MIRREEFCGGRLVKEIEQVDMISAATMRHVYVNGRHTWMLDGEEITPIEADAFKILWESQP